MDQCRGIERLPGSFARQPRRGELAQLAVDKGQKLFRGPGFALLDGGQDTCHVVHRSGCRRPPRRHPRPGPKRQRPAGPVPAGMSPGTARFQLNGLPRKRTAA